VGVRRHVLAKCTDSTCCCATTPIQTMESLAAHVREAMEAVDLEVMRELLAPDARWGAPEQDVPTCRNASEILSWYELARANGVRAEITEVVVVNNTILIGLKILATSQTSAKVNTRWQVLSVDDGRIAEIRGYERRGEAMTFATSGVSQWSA
jgi:ketosteroid isomerase-like protein